MNKGREFWLVKSDPMSLDHYVLYLPPIGEKHEVIKVIEYQAYKKALQTLKEISLSTEFIHGYGEVPTEPAKKALETLKELGEHE